MHPDEREQKRPLAVDRKPTPVAAADPIQAWEEIEAGRYMPRRTRGSFPGRELG